MEGGQEGAREKERGKKGVPLYSNCLTSFGRYSVNPLRVFLL